MRTPLEADWRAAFGRGGGDLARGGLGGDGVHPPPHGMRLIAHAVWQKLSTHRAPRRLPHRTASKHKLRGRSRRAAETRRLQGTRGLNETLTPLTD